MNENVLKKLLKPKSESEIVESFLKPAPVQKKKILKKPGRPKVADDRKAKNFTLCLAHQYLEFIDKMTVKDPKVQGRGRKIRFIIDRFIEHEKRSIGQVKVIKNALSEVQVVLTGFGGRVKKGEKLQLSIKDRQVISKEVDKVHVLLRILQYSPKTLQRILPREEWAILSFCLDWKNNRGVTI